MLHRIAPAKASRHSSNVTTSDRSVTPNTNGRHHIRPSRSATEATIKTSANRPACAKQIYATFICCPTTISQGDRGGQFLHHTTLHRAHRCQQMDQPVQIPTNGSKDTEHSHARSHFGMALQLFHMPSRTDRNAGVVIFMKDVSSTV